MSFYIIKLNTKKRFETKKKEKHFTQHRLTIRGFKVLFLSIRVYLFCVVNKKF